MDCDLFPFLTADGPTQMAADEALLEHVITTGRPALRFYNWDPPTLSLGYFQPYASRLPGLPVVRRMTGGGAIVHDRELTYALGLPPGPIQKDPHWACRMHDIIRVALAEWGVTAVSGCGLEVGRGAFLCFEHQSPGDLLLGGHKIGGSAQRKRDGVILQHGSILLAASQHAPRFHGIRELTGTTIDPQGFADRLGRTLSRITGWSPAPVEWSVDLKARRWQLGIERYANPAWTERR
jgi:lipoyl(octanoyl) transferase